MVRRCGVIGEGAFVVVIRYKDDNGPDFAVKELLSTKEIERFTREIDILEALAGCPNIMPLLKRSPDGHSYSMPLADEVLEKYIR
ncbi:hypothetical protein [Listeria rustica]|uniref:Protein kinase domain-containing protein n=1 Tax=Listeria rustica TaxID=2713503 RepID=A0A7W1T945_9LIST|nr:hypothetical protein [Listeria rustica]MBA3927725.1 hypothetical protein [Listeria rustica]